MQDVQSVLDVVRLGGASANQCERCDGIIKRRDGAVDYEGGILQYITWHPQHHWVVQDRLCDCAIGVAMGKRPGSGDISQITDARWFDPQRDTSLVFTYRKGEIENDEDRWTHYRKVLEKVGTRRGKSVDDELALIPKDRWGENWWKGPPQSKWQNPFWQESLGLL